MMLKVTDNVYVGNTFRGCNSSFVITSKGTVIIDTPMVPSEAKQWREEVEKYGEIRYVINNEPHNDHVAGNCWLGGVLVTHEETGKAIKSNSKESLEGQMKWMAPDAVPLDKDFHYRLPDITFAGEMTLYLGEYTFRIMSVPGHTASQTAVFVPEEKILFTSDNVSMTMPIMIDAVPRAWLESLTRLQKLDADKIVPGHGDVSDKSALQKTYDNVNYITGEVEAAIAKGWTLEEVQDKVTLSERFPIPESGDMMKQMRRESLAGLYNSLRK